MKRTPLFVFVFTGICCQVSNMIYSMKNTDKKNIKILLHSTIDKGNLMSVKTLKEYAEKYSKKYPEIINAENSIGQTVLDKALCYYVYNKENSHKGQIFEERTKIYKEIVTYLLSINAQRKKTSINYHHIEERQVVLKTILVTNDLMKEFEDNIWNSK